jgi:tRNA-splicing ligase RtcB (3'-phosphate/5'-hydroxy nucleic acid ligase)
LEYGVAGGDVTVGGVSKLAVFGFPQDEGAVRQIKTCLEDERAVSGALMADHHLGYAMPIGGVIAYEGAISPSGVGFDIACGNKAVRTNLQADEVRESVPRLLAEIQERVEFGIGRRNQTPIEHELFDAEVWDDVEGLAPGLREKAMAQLGTVGSGNHYVDLLVDEEGRLWVANHFGSRGLGHTLATGFLNLAKGAGFLDPLVESEDATVLSMSSDLGQLYFECMNLAGEYAYAGRDYVIDQVLNILEARAEESVHNHHNFAWLEDGKYVVRKGATPLTSDLAFIGGSMGDESVIVRGSDRDIGALGSAPHGAGRVMSRTKAAGKFKKVAVERTAPDGSTFTKKIRVRDASTAAIDWQAVHADLADRGITVLGAGADEAPAAYKRLCDVIAAHENIVVVHRLSPIGVVMAGEDMFDPYKD